MDYRELYQRLEKLDAEMSKLKTEESFDPRVSFEYKIGRPKPDREGTLWYPVELSISPKAGFDINKIQKVIYILHPTFTPSRIAVSNVKEQFALRLKCFGVFHAMAVVVLEPVNGHSEIVKLIRFLPVGLSPPQEDYLK